MEGSDCFGTRRILMCYINPANSMFRTQLKQKSCPPGSPDTRLLIERAGHFHSLSNVRNVTFLFG